MSNTITRHSDPEIESHTPSVPSTQYVASNTPMRCWYRPVLGGAIIPNKPNPRSAWATSPIKQLPQDLREWERIKFWQVLSLSLPVPCKISFHEKAVFIPTWECVFNMRIDLQLGCESKSSRIIRSPFHFRRIFSWRAWRCGLDFMAGVEIVRKRQKFAPVDWSLPSNSTKPRGYRNECIIYLAMDSKLVGY